MNKDETRQVKLLESVQPDWKRIIVESNIPESLNPLRELSKNFWWVWNTRASDLFSYISKELWEEVGHNPTLLLDEVSYKRYKELEKDHYFLSEMEHVHKEFLQYMKEREKPDSPRIAYFSM